MCGAATTAAASARLIDRRWKENHRTRAACSKQHHNTNTHVKRQIDGRGENKNKSFHWLGWLAAHSTGNLIT